MASAVPSIIECIGYMDDFSMWENIRRHSFMVARVADLILNGLNITTGGGGTPAISRELVISGALLHDIAKTKCLQEGCRHADIGEEICRELGYPEVAKVVANHVILANFRETEYRQGCFSAVELVYYADKRVKHDQVVSLDDRLVYIIDKYANNEAIREDHIRRNFKQCQDIESYLFARLPFAPQDIGGMLAESPEELLTYPPEPTGCD